jgi:hypothetical protein
MERYPGKHLNEDIMVMLRRLEKSLDSFPRNFAVNVLKNSEISEKQWVLLNKLYRQETSTTKYQLSRKEAVAESYYDSYSSDTHYDYYDSGIELKL